jgi:hypothetical protein
MALWGEGFLDNFTTKYEKMEIITRTLAKAQVAGNEMGLMTFFLDGFPIPNRL